MRAALPLLLVTLGTTPAFADSLPTRKAGLWESAVTAMAGAPSVKVKQCIDERTDRLAESATSPGATCAKRDVRKVQTGYEIVSSCTVGGMVIDATGLVSGDFVSAVRIDLTTTMKGMPGQPAGFTQKMVVDTKRVGECEADQKPGDMIMPNGQVVRTPGT